MFYVMLDERRYCTIVLDIRQSVNLDDDMDDDMPKHGNKLPTTQLNTKSRISKDNDGHHYNMK